MKRAIVIMILVFLAGACMVQAGQKAKQDAPKPLTPSEGPALGKWCLTTAQSILTATRFEAAEVLGIGGSGDHVAWRKLFADGKAVQLQPGLRAYIMETSFPFVRIHLEGQTTSGWTWARDLEKCRYNEHP